MATITVQKRPPVQRAEDFSIRKRYLEKDRDHTLMQIHRLQNHLVEIKKELEHIEQFNQVRLLNVTEHAIERFKERYGNLPIKKIRQILTSNELLERYRKKGEGRYELKEAVGMIAVIKNFNVVTVINTADPARKLEVLSAYMEYYTDELVTRAIAQVEAHYKIMSFKTFTHLYWKNQNK